MIAATRMGDKVNSKLFGDEAYEGDDSYVNEDNNDYGNTDDIDMPNSEGDNYIYSLVLQP